MGKLLFGCSGWSYNEWVGPLYTDKKISKLNAYSNIFNTTEINTTFYSYPKPGIISGWLKFSPKEFIYTAKIPGQITHDKELNIEKKVEQDLNTFLKLMDPLVNAKKIGCFLIQLPPRLKFISNKVEDFYTLLPQKYKFAIEFRNETWLNEKSIKLLDKYNIAYTIIDEPLLPSNIYITADFAYFRWHGKGKKPWYDYLYTQDELKEWIPKIEKAQDQVETVYGYFNNHYHGYAPENCLDILDMLGVITPEQKQVKEKIKNYRKEPQPQTTTLIQYFGKTKTPIEKKETTESFLRYFADEGRILRGRVIKKEDIKNIKTEKQKIIAKIRDYDITINQEDKTIKHDCDDWRIRKNQKKFCKHIIKLLLTLPEKKSELILKDIKENLTKWKFE